MDDKHVNEQQLNVVNQSVDKTAELPSPYAGPRWLVEERDACGVGFIANGDKEKTGTG